MPHPSSHSNMYTNVSNDNNDLHNMNIKQIVMLIFSSSHQLHCCQCKLLMNLSFWEQISFQSFFPKSFLSAIHLSQRKRHSLFYSLGAALENAPTPKCLLLFLHQLWGCEDRQNCHFSQKVTHSLAEADGNQQHTLWESSLAVLEMPQSIKLHRQLQTTHDVYIGDGQLPTFPPLSPLLLQTPVMNLKTLPAGCWQPRQHTSEENNTQLWTLWQSGLRGCQGFGHGRFPDAKGFISSCSALVNTKH